MNTYLAILQAELPWLLLLFAAMFGLIIGSFLNVVILRIPVMLNHSWRNEANLILENETEEIPRFNLFTPGSTCPSCGHKIRAWENIPLVSWLLLKGKCSHCKASISPRYPLIELATAILTCTVIAHFGISAVGFAACLLTWVLLVLSMIDFDHQLLPDNITLPFLWLGLILNADDLFVPLESALWGAVAGYLVLWIIFWVFKLTTGKEGMGYGDFKLLALLGAWLGWQHLPMIIVLSSFSGALLGGLLILLGRDKSHPIPFGPYLAIAGWLTLLWGDQLFRFYWNLMS